MLSDLTQSIRYSRRGKPVAVTVGFLIIGWIAMVAVIIGNQGFGGVGLLITIGKATLVAGLSTMLFGQIGASFVSRHLPGSSSLTEVSDWLSKMVVGAGLVLIPLGSQLAGPVVDFLALGSPKDPQSASLGLLVALYFGVSGATLGVQTRSVLVADAAREADTLLLPPAEKELAQQGRALAARLPFDLDRDFLSGRDRHALTVAAHQSMYSLLDAFDKFCTAKAQLIIGETYQTVPLLKRVLSETEDFDLIHEVRILCRRADYTFLFDDIDAREKELVARHRMRREVPVDVIRDMFESLYRPKPDGFVAAIELGEHWATGVPNNPQLFVYLACAYGQQFSYIMRGADRNADRLTLSRDAEAARERALYCVKQALDIDASWRPLLRSFWDPSGLGEDDDLTGFHGDAAFAALLDPSGVVSAVTADPWRSGLPSLTLAQDTQYRGKVLHWLSASSGELFAANEDVYRVKPNARLRACLSMCPHDIASERPAVAIATEGEKRDMVDFVLRPEALTSRFAVTAVSASVPAEAPGQVIELMFDGPDTPGEHEVWLEVSQNGRTVQFVRFSLEVA